MKIPKALTLTARILLAVLLVLSLFGHISGVFFEDVSFLYRFPQTLYGYFFLLAIAAAAIGGALLILLMIFTALLLSALYLPLIFPRIRSLVVKAAAYLILSVMLTADAFILFKLGQSGGFVVPAITDLAALALASFVFFTDLYANKKTKK